MPRRVALAVGASAIAVLALAGAAASQRTAYPGKNGKIAYVADTYTKASEVSPAWQPLPRP